MDSSEKRELNITWKKGQVITGILFVAALVLYSLYMYELFFLQTSHAYIEDIYMKFGSESFGYYNLIKQI